MDEAVKGQADDALALMSAARKAVDDGNWDQAEALLVRLIQSVHDLRLRIRDERAPSSTPVHGQVFDDHSKR